MINELKESIYLARMLVEIFDKIKNDCEKEGITPGRAMGFLVPAMIAATWAQINEKDSPYKAHEWLVEGSDGRGTTAGRNDAPGIRGGSERVFYFLCRVFSMQIYFWRRYCLHCFLRRIQDS